MTNYDSYFKNTTPVPHADASGRQEGVIPPGLRNYKPGTYKVVDNAEATLNMLARKRGEIDLIKGGQDNASQKATDKPNTTDEALLSIPPKITPPTKTIKADTDTSSSSDFDLTDDDGVIDVPAKLPARRKKYADQTEYEEKPQQPYGSLNVEMVTMEIRQEHQDGTYSSLITVGLPVCKVVQNSVAVTLISPVTAGQYTFQPAAGSDILLNGAGLNNLHVFYPGTGFVLDDLHLSGMCFVKAN